MVGVAILMALVAGLALPAHAGMLIFQEAAWRSC